MKIQSNMYINNPDMTSRNIEKKENSSHALVQEDDIQISDSARKLVETARNKVSDFHTMHFSSINGEIREIPAEYKCENLFKLDLKAASISGEQSAFEGCSENQSEVFEKWLVDGPVVRFDLAGNDIQKGRFSDPVFPDDPDLFSPYEFVGEIP